MNLTISFHLRPARGKGQNAVVNTHISIGGVRGVPFSAVKASEKLAENFDRQRQRFKGNAPENAVLEAIEAKIKSLYAYELQKGNNPTPKELKALYDTNGKQIATTYAEVAEQHLHFIEIREGKDLGHRSIETYHVYYNTFLAYLDSTQNKGIGIEKISIPIVKGYEMVLIGRKYSETHIKKSIRYIKNVLKYAVNSGIIKANPLAEYQFEWYSKNAKEIVFLSFEESEKIFSKPYPNPTLQKVVDLLHFACLTSLAYIDIQTFDYEKHTYIDSGEVWVRKHREKETGTQIFPLESEALAILQKYKYQLPTISNQKFNFWLKELAQLHQIEKNLTTHIGRRTFVSQGFISGKYGLEAMSRITGDNPATLLKHYGKLMPQAIKNDRNRYKEGK